MLDLPKPIQASSYLGRFQAVSFREEIIYLPIGICILGKSELDNVVAEDMCVYIYVGGI